MSRRFQFSLRTALLVVFLIALAAWPTTRWLRTYIANRGLAVVKGSVTLKGKPLDNAKIIWFPWKGGKPAEAVTNAAGIYELDPPIKPGQYAIGITDAVGEGRIPPKYADGSTSGITVYVQEGAGIGNYTAIDLRD